MAAVHAFAFPSKEVLRRLLALNHQRAISRLLCQLIGQSVDRLSETLREAHPEMDWRSIIGLRNVLAHDYRRLPSPV